MRVGAYILCGPFGWLVKYRFHGRRLVGSGGRSRGEGYRDHGGMRWGKNQSRTMPITIHPAKAPAVTCAILRRTGCASIHATPSTNLSPAYRRNSKFAPRRFIQEATATTTARKAMSSVMSSTMGIIFRNPALLKSGPAIADGAALFGHGSEGFHGPRSTILFLFFVAPCFDRGGAPGPLLGMKSKFVVISVSIYFTG